MALLSRIPLVSESLTRRGFLVGAAATAVLAACGSSGSDRSNRAGGASVSSTPAPIGTSGTGSDGTYTLAQRFPPNVQVPGPVRLPISLASSDGQLIQDGPDTLTAQVTDIDGNPLGDPITASRRDVEPGPYYDFRTVVDEVGVYYLVVDDGPSQGAAFQIMEPTTVTVAGPGQPLPPFDTPTVADARGVDPICTRQPEQCPFHDITLTDALASGRQVVYLIGTPAFCQTGSCAPALESLIDVQERFGDTFAFIHAEVYTDNTATTTAPAVAAAGLEFEPALFITDTAGVVISRLDAVWNQAELTEVLQAASA